MMTRTRQTINPEQCKKECIKEAQSCNVDPCTVPIVTTPEPPMPTTTLPPPSTTTTAAAATKMCQIYGDPHVIAFDGHMDQGDTAQLSTDGLGVLWAVKSDEVKIQVDASETNHGTGTGWGRSTGLAFAGYGHRLVFLRDGKKTLFNGQEIVKENGTYKSDDGLSEVERMATLDPNATEWQELGYGEVHISDKVHSREAWAWRLNKKITIYLSEGDSLCAIIRMPKVEGMDGLCGNFDDDRANDVEMPHDAEQPQKIIERMTYIVGANDPENMFATASPSLLEQENRVVTRTAAPAPVRTIQDCEPELKKKAEEKCAEIKEKTLSRDCVFDICMTGELGDEEDEVEMEVLETIAKTVPGLP
jgi:hypothetical protein